MKQYLYILIVCIALTTTIDGQIQDTLLFKGQASVWGHLNEDNAYPLYLGGRLIPQLNYEIQLSESRLIDFEVSYNGVGDVGINFGDSTDFNSKLSAYRVWGRYSTQQFEARVGLQKINFGSASILRPLMWFDQVDPRDPLQLTDGVWAALGRYYFMNNANLWVWALYGNKNPKGWEIMKSNKTIPEVGGRFQMPVPAGEAALSYHFRMADSRDLQGMVPAYAEIPEHKIGLDARFDLEVGFWCEGAWIHQGKDMGIFTNQEVLNVGVDYTFGIGNGLNAIVEHLLTSYDQHAFAFDDPTQFTALSMNYPFGLFDNINTIIYYNWTDNQVYNFINWSKQYDHLTLNFMGYWNPDIYQMPLRGGAENLFGGKGLQLMAVFNF